jgi:integrase
VVLAVLSGLRRGELAALRQEDFTGDAVVVDESVYRGSLGDPKTPKSRRRVVVGPLVQAALREWITISRFREPKDFMFAMRRNVPIDPHHVVARHIKPACKRAGVPVCSWHDFRHTYTTWNRRAGVPAEIVRDQLGHTSVAITLDIYSHVQDGASGAASVEGYAKSGWGSGTQLEPTGGNEYRLTI